MKKLLSLALVLILTLALAVPAFAAETKNVKISAVIEVDGKVDFSYTIPNVMKTEKIPTAEASKWSTEYYYGGYGKAGQTVNVYNIAVGEKIYVNGAFNYAWTPVDLKNGKLQGITKDYSDNLAKFNNDFKRVDLPDGGWYGIFTSKAYIQFNQEGYYLFSLLPFAGNSYDWANAWVTNNAFKYDTAVILRVVKSDSKETAAPSTSTPSKETTTQKPTVPADKNAVEVAGTYRIPGRIQNYSGGYLYTVNHGDTLYDLSERFYGSGDLWKELQKANQTWLNETKDGIIFVGFNLLLPTQLDGVRANIG